MSTQSLLSIDVGFDVREHRMLTVLELPLEGGSVRHHDLGSCADALVTSGDLVSVAEALARHGYGMIVCRLSANGREVQCTPADWAPPGEGKVLGDICWAVQPHQDNYWCRSHSLDDALRIGKWKRSDLRANVVPGRVQPPLLVHQDGRNFYDADRGRIYRHDEPVKDGDMAAAQAARDAFVRHMQRAGIAFVWEVVRRG